MLTLCALSSPAAAEPHCLHTGCTEVAAEESFQLLHATLLSFLRCTHTVTHTLIRGCHVEMAAVEITVLLTGCLGSDLLKLTRDDLVQICGPADGIRLFNALKSRCVCVCVCA